MTPHHFLTESRFFALQIADGPGAVVVKTSSGPSCLKGGQLYPVDHESLSSAANVLQTTLLTSFPHNTILKFDIYMLVLYSQIIILLEKSCTHFTCWIANYPVDKIIRPLNNWGLVFKL